MTRIHSRFSSTSTALEVVEGIDLTGRRAMVTGASSGIGVETARALAHAGAQVTLAVRDVAAGERVAADLARTSGRADLAVVRLDLADLTSVDRVTAGWTGPLHVLVNNAGVMDTPRGRTAQGWETQLGTNHLGHFALATGLHGALAEAGDARVVVVSSSGHAASPVVFDDLFFERRAYEPGLAYGQSKTANALFAVESTRRWAQDGITANALNPGGIWTPLQRHWSAEQRAAAERQSREAEGSGLFHMKTPEQGAATSVFLATSPLVAEVGGRYFEDCQKGRDCRAAERHSRRAAPRAGTRSSPAALGRQPPAAVGRQGHGRLTTVVTADPSVVLAPTHASLAAGRPLAGNPKPRTLGERYGDSLVSGP